MQPPYQKRARVSDTFLNSGVKKLFIIAIAHEVQENYENLKTFLETIGMRDINFTLSMDLKCTNIILGLQAHGAKHPCHFCESAKPFDETADLRTLGRIKVVLHSL